MKGVRSIINLSLVLLIIGVFPSLVLAHGDNTATAEAAAGGDQQAMMDFVAHAKEHLDNAGGINGVVQFRAEMRKDNGTWKSGYTYLITIGQDGSVISHGRHTNAMYGDFINEFPTVKSLMATLMGDKENIHCEMNNASHVCAAYYASPFGGRENIVIGGFDHKVDSEHVKHLKCDGYEPAVTARELQERQDGGASEDALEEDLQILVRDAILWASKLPSPGMAGQYEPDILSGVRCFTKGSARGPWKHESIYFFVMTNDEPAFVAVNGNNQELTGSQFTGVLDENNVDVGKEIINAAGENGKGGFVKYLWDDPKDPDDGVAVAECHNAPDPCAPGNSPKISYVEGTKFPNFTGQQDTVFIFGSGIYPKMEEQSSDSDDGCAIAGSQNTAENTLFNLLLIVSGLFLAMSWRKNRSAGKA